MSDMYGKPTKNHVLLIYLFFW